MIKGFVARTDPLRVKLEEIWGETSQCFPAVPHGSRRNTDNSGPGLCAPGDGNDHVEAVPQGRARAARRRPGRRGRDCERPSRALEAQSERVTQRSVVTFYSYKGGTGRTMALANVAWIIAATASGCWWATGTWNRRACTTSSVRSSTNL